MFNDDPRIQAILEEILESGKDAQAACGDDLGLLPAVKERLAQLHSLENHLEEVLPVQNPHDRSGGEATLPLTGKLPMIAGYEIDSIVGFGGMGIVYLGRHLKLKRKVAIKMLLAGAYLMAHAVQLGDERVVVRPLRAAKGAEKSEKSLDGLLWA